MPITIIRIRITLLGNVFREMNSKETVRRKGQGCPFLKSCGVKVTKDFFIRVCMTSGYVNCHHFAKKIDDLRKPIEWLQKMAVEREGRYMK